ncbi:MAG: hypothetical protein JSW18_00030 [Candidatus Omnitrophota bacterium]|nr:MAG: hypothetical protein JSW18_00030 [Candidatus Omnitrophota bacterium]
MRFISALLVAFIVLTLSGCGILVDSVREAADYPSLELVRARKDAIRQSLDISYDKAFEQALVLLKEMEAIIYTKNKRDHSITAMGIKSCIDTTEVGIFFIEESSDKTIVEIASHSPKAKDFVSSKIFAGLAEGE